jgi:methyltransferase family protein
LSERIIFRVPQVIPYLRFYLGALSKRLHRKLILSHLRLLEFVRVKRPIPLGYWLALRIAVRTIFPSSDPLSVPYDVLENTGASLRSPELQRLLRNDVLGTWALDVPTIDFLWERMKRDTPKIIIECGAGISTVVLASYATTFGAGSGDPLVISLEQSFHVKQETESRLTRDGLSNHVRILHAPVSEQGRYEIETEQLALQLRKEKVDWLFIDGPSGPNGCRVWTLALLSKLCRPGARWFLDDAFRDGELSVLRDWSHWPGVVVEGIYPIGKGLATGVIKDPQPVNLACDHSQKTTAADVTGEEVR